ncbi:unnamed protein product [Meloidogyne enterolobii]|uniref:Uncharacterized protein n=1 Tax=Meloidogyne enterolobii TaxID=390850 RepID=A0ACB0YUC2_MELEN
MCTLLSFKKFGSTSLLFLLNFLSWLTLIGRCWSKQWVNSLHSKLSREYGLSGFIFDEVLIFLTYFIFKILQEKLTNCESQFCIF